MWKVDPDARLVAVGDVGKWSETMLSLAGTHMNLISEHIYCQEKPDLLAHTKQLAEEIHRKAKAHRGYRQTIPGLAARDIRIAMDEWNYWYGDYIYGELGVRYHLKDGLGVAVGLHEYFRNSDIFFMANYAQTVNVIGCIKTTPTAASFETTGLVLKLYRNHFGTIPIQVGNVPDPLDVTAAWTSDRKALTIAVVNAGRQPQELAIQCTRAALAKNAKMWQITGTDPEEYNEPGVAQRIQIHESDVALDLSRISVPALSVVLYRIEAR
jgi:alpha-N-arabinofuranosidase